VKYLRLLGWRCLGVIAYLSAASLWCYAAATTLDSYNVVCQPDHRQAGIAIYSVQNFLVWVAPLLIARGRVAIGINTIFGFVVLSAAILFTISARNAPECMTKDNPHIDSSGWFEFDSIADLAIFISYAVAVVDLLRWGSSKMKPASEKDGSTR